MSFTRSQIIEIADSRTERRKGKLDLNAEILLAIQDICQYRKWWWRRKTVQFQTVANQSEYDLSTSGLAGDFQQFLKDGVKLYDDNGEVGCLDPEFSTSKQDLALVMATKTQSTPSRYFMKPGSYRTMVLTPTPNAVWTVLGSHWAVPDSTPDAQEETIPLIPSFLHPALLSRLEARINKFTLGEGSALYNTSMAEYKGQIDQAAQNDSFAEGQSYQSLAGAHGDAIQST